MSLLTNQLFGISEPLIQHVIGPHDAGFPERVRIRERFDRRRRTVVNAPEPRALFITIERMASSAAPFEQLFASCLLLSCGNRERRAGSHAGDEQKHSSPHAHLSERRVD